MDCIPFSKSNTVTVINFDIIKENIHKIILIYLVDLIWIDLTRQKTILAFLTKGKGLP